MPGELAFGDFGLPLGRAPPGDVGLPIRCLLLVGGGDGDEDRGVEIGEPFAVNFGLRRPRTGVE